MTDKNTKRAFTEECYQLAQLATSIKISSGISRTDGYIMQDDESIKKAIELLDKCKKQKID